jgi:hypothetical protein
MRPRPQVVAFTVWTDQPTAAAARLRTAVRQADVNRPLTRLRSIEEIPAQSMATRRFHTWMVGLRSAPRRATWCG